MIQAMKLGRAMLVVAKPSRSMCSSTNLGSIQKEFSVQSDWFEDNWNARSGTPSKEIMQWVMSVMDIENREKEKVLDVAAGTCIFARSLAQSGAGSVIALDATLEMLKKGEAAAKKEGITNLKCVEGDALHLPFEDSSFDMVACRLCLHHFPDPLLCVQEMTRVVKSGGVVCIVDLTSSEDKASADEMNRLENLRDPTHTYALSKSSLLDMMLTANLKPEVQAPEDLPTLPVLMDLQAWMQATNTPPAASVTIERSVDIELKGGSSCGMNPFQMDNSEYENGTIGFRHMYTVAVATKK